MGSFSRTLDIIDSHTCGQATRTLTGGVPRLHGANMMEKMQYFEKNCNWIKSVLTSEPRGNNLTSVAVLAEPTLPEADVGAFYFEAHGYMPLCGHDTIGLCTALVETGRVEVREPLTIIRLETPAGLLRVEVEVQQGRAVSVAFVNAPCFCYGDHYSIEYHGRQIEFAIAYGGNNYAIVPASALGLSVDTAHRSEVIQTGIELLERIDAKYGREIVHPENPLICGVSHMMIAEYVQIESDSVHSKNCVMTELDSFDRSPCGTGTSARTALLYAQEILKPGMRFFHKSIIDSVFEVEIVDEVQVGPYKAVVPKIKGSAHLTGFAKIIVDPHDEKGFGFTV